MHYDKFLKQFGDSGEVKNPIQKFEQYLTEQIEDWLKKQDKAKDTLKTEYAVADLQLAFDNTPLMNMLTNRAIALKAGKFEKAR